MKRFPKIRFNALAMLALFILACPALSAEEMLDSKIDNVTVFLTGAQVSRTADVSLSPGNNTIVFGGISASIQPASLQMSTIGDFKIIDVKYNLAYPEPVALNKPLELPEHLRTELSDLELQLLELNFKIEDLQNSITVLTREKQLIDQNALMTGKSARADTMPVLREAISFYHEKMMSINKQLLEAKKAMLFLNKDKTELTSRCNTIQQWHQKNNPQPVNANAPIHQVVATVYSERAMAGRVEFNYMVSGAGWSPSYDIRAEKINQPIELSYKGEVYQQTGVDWDEVKLTVCTGNPNRNNDRPVLTPWYVDFCAPPPVAYRRDGLAKEKVLSGAGSNMKTEISQEQSDESYAFFNGPQGNTGPQGNSGSNGSTGPQGDMGPAGSDGNFIPIQQSVQQLSVSYEVDICHSIPSDGKGHTVRLQDEEIDAEYEYHSVPKLDRTAFLLAKVPNWNELNLLPGTANLFFEGTYVGQSQINSATTADTLLLSLGRDDAISLRWEKQNCESEESFFSKTITRKNTFEIVMRNNKSEAIVLDLLDQLPLTRNKDIEIRLVEDAGAEYIKEYGKLSWKVPLAAGETKKLRFTYSVKSPREKVIAGI